MNGVVVEGLVKVVLVSLQFLIEQLDVEGAANKDKMPMLCADLTLVGDQVRFNPEAGEATSGKGLRDLVTSWVDSFFNVATLFKRLDDAEGRYVKELVNDVGITMLISRLNDCLVANERLFTDFKAPYDNFSYLWTMDLHTTFAAFLERSYYTSESGVKVPNLANFNAEIAKYRKVQAQLNEFKTPTDVGWLRVNSEPIKQALSTYVTKWSYAFSEHLHDYVLGKLTELHDFIVRVEKGLAEPVVMGDKEALKRVMGHMRDVRRSTESRADMFAPLRDAVAALKAYGACAAAAALGALRVRAVVCVLLCTPCGAIRCSASHVTHRHAARGDAAGGARCGRVPRERADQVGVDRQQDVPVRQLCVCGVGCYCVSAPARSVMRARVR